MFLWLPLGLINSDEPPAVGGSSPGSVVWLWVFPGLLFLFVCLMYFNGKLFC